MSTNARTTRAHPRPVFPAAALTNPLAFALAAALAGVLTGCSTSREISGTAYQGPDIALADTPAPKPDDDGNTQNPTPDADRWHAVVTLPQPGWSVSEDAADLAADGWQVFMTLRRPDPQFIYPQVIVDQRVRTRAPTNEPVTVFARVLDHASEAQGSYARAARAQPTDQPPADQQDAGR